MSGRCNKAAKRLIGHRRMIETFAAHESRQFEGRYPAVLEDRKYCIASEGGLAMCGKTAYRTLHYLRFSACEDKRVCGQCAELARMIAKEARKVVTND